MCPDRGGHRAGDRMPHRHARAREYLIMIWPLAHFVYMEKIRRTRASTKYVKRGMSADEIEVIRAEQRERRKRLDHERYIRHRSRRNQMSAKYYREHREELLAKKKIIDRQRRLGIYDRQINY